MKKLISIVLSLLLAFSLTACDSSIKSQDSDLRGTISTAGNDNNGNSDSSKNSNSENTSTGNDSADTSKEFSLGQSLNNTWENKYIGLGCKLPASWIFKTDKEIAELNGFSQEFIPEDFASQLSSAQVIYDMFAQSADGLSSINVNLEKVTNTQISSFDIEESLKVASGITEDGYKNMGFKNIVTNIGDVNVDGKSLKCMNLTASLDDFSITIKSFIVICSGHVASVTICATTETELQQILNTIYWLK